MCLCAKHFVHCWWFLTETKNLVFVRDSVNRHVFCFGSFCCFASWYDSVRETLEKSVTLTLATKNHHSYRKLMNLQQSRLKSSLTNRIADLSIVMGFMCTLASAFNYRVNINYTIVRTAELSICQFWCSVYEVRINKTNFIIQTNSQYCF